MIDETIIRQAAKACGIPMIGITDAKPLTDFESRLIARKDTPFVRIKPAVRINYQAAFQKVQGVIVIGIPYALKIQPPDDISGRGRISSYCRNDDYHNRLMDKMHALMSEVMKNSGVIEYACFVDNAKLVDRASAWRAGLGFFGKNNTLINPTYGSAFNIGQILIDTPINFEPATPMKSQCNQCRRCINACPNGALGNGFDLDAHRCISCLNQKKKLTEIEKQRITQYIFGCDLCQLACPHNLQQPADHWDNDRLNQAWPILKDIIEMDDEAYEKAFGDSALHWRGKAILIRNAKIIQENEKR